MAAAILAFLAIAPLTTPPARAQHVEVQSGESDALARVSIVKNKSKNIKLDVPFADATVGSTEIADIVPISDRQLYILGKKIGTTNVLLYDRDKRLIGVVDVEVRLDTGSLGAKIRAASGGDGIHVQDVDGRLVLSGNGGDAQTIERAMSVAGGLGGGPVVNALRAKPNQQVMLKVRFVEANRSAARALGVRWQIANGRASGIIGTESFNSAKFRVPTGTFGMFSSNNAGSTGIQGNSVPVFDVVTNTLTAGSPFATIIGQLIKTNNFNLDVVLSALEERGVVRRLAEPNLVALSGESADFLAGGQFPVPVAQTGGGGGVPVITITWKEFGVFLRFTPTVLPNDVISLRLEPEVSDLDPTLAVSVSGVTTPGLSVRRARTTVELRDGQTFAIAGLIQAKSERQLDQVPWLGSVPVLGALFRSSDFQAGESELVALVTPYIVKPVPPRGKDPKLKTPLDTSLAGNDIDFFLGGREEIPKSPPTYVTPTGAQEPLLGGIAPGAPAATPLPPPPPPSIAPDAPPPPTYPVQRLFSGFFAPTPANPPQQ